MRLVLVLECLEIVALPFAIPFLEGAKSPSGDGDLNRLSILWVHQMLLLEVGEEFALYLHVGVGDELSG